LALCVLGVGAPLSVIALVAPAHAVLVNDSKTRTVSFSGASCGDRDNAVFTLPPGARSIRLNGPEVGDQIASATGDDVVAEVSSVRRSGHRMIVTVRGAAAVCTNPAAYPKGWETEDVDLDASFKRQEPVTAFADCRNDRQRPSHIVVACGDGNLQLEGVRWSRWGGTVAVGHGRALFNDCTPYCAVGKFHRAPATVRLSQPRYCSSADHYVYRKLIVYISGKGRQSTTFGWLC
jgi:hypothetical protein